jgi:hypothetical protein
MAGPRFNQDVRGIAESIFTGLWIEHETIMRALRVWAKAIC